jgi:hypothetical protein
MIRRLVLASLTLLAPSISAAIDITTCGQTVPVGQVGELSNDLDCGSGEHAAGVLLETRATLRLNGHRINGPVTGAALIRGIGRTAKVIGPGEVDTHGVACIAGDASLVVDGVGGLDIHHCYYGVSSENLTISNLTLHDTTQMAASALHLKATNVAAFDIGFGGLYGSRSARVDNVTVSGGDVFGVEADNLTVKNSFISGNTRGVSGERIAIRKSEITGNPEHGAKAWHFLSVVDSEVTGNGFAPDEVGEAPNVDLYTDGRIVVRRTTCGTSADRSGSLGVCTDD